MGSTISGGPTRRRSRRSGAETFARRERVPSPLEAERQNRNPNVIFVIGPSRSGKTTLLSAILPEFPSLTLLDLDAEESRCVPLLLARGADPGGWEGRWRRNRECLLAAEAASSGSDVIVD